MLSDQPPDQPPKAQQPPAPSIAGPDFAPVGRLSRYRVLNAPPGADVYWAVTPSARVDRATTPRHLLEFVPHSPGELLLIAVMWDKSKPENDPVEVTLQVHAVGQKPPEPPVDPVATARRSIVRIQSGNAGCTATVIGEARPDGSQTLLTAAHCLRGVGSTGTVWMNDGSKATFRCEAWDAKADLAWLVTDGVHKPQPSLKLSTVAPAVGDTVFHAGYGIDKPGSVETGRVLAGEDDNGQIRFRLSVSSGDSGGGICLTAKGEVLAAVCCTTAPGREGDVWGGSARRAAELRPVPVLSERVAPDWTPIPIPQRMPEAEPRAVGGRIKK